jgi:hypothetical protein
MAVAIRTFKSNFQAMRDVLPNSNTMGAIGREIMNYIKEKIDNNETAGSPLSQKTIDRKNRIGALKPVTTKLREGGDLRDKIKETHSIRGVEIGWGGENHEPLITRSGTIKVCDLAKVHHTGSGVPKRTVLEFDKTTDDIIKDKIRQRIIGTI